MLRIIYSLPFRKMSVSNLGLRLQNKIWLEVKDAKIRKFPSPSTAWRSCCPRFGHICYLFTTFGRRMEMARTQAYYDSACMVCGRNEARSFLESPDPASHVNFHYERYYPQRLCALFIRIQRPNQIPPVSYL